MYCLCLQQTIWLLICSSTVVAVLSRYILHVMVDGIVFHSVNLTSVI